MTKRKLKLSILVFGLGLSSAVFADQQILDDLIVDGSVCVGFDCVNGETFEFDTIRLKENNTRLRFDDTSTSSSFPRNDWQLTANETSNGGMNKFSIDDLTAGTVPFLVEAGAGNHALYIDADGHLGFGTSMPSVGLHQASGNSPTLRLEQDVSEGWEAQSWDVGGNEANFFIRDVTGGGVLPFRILPGAPANSLVVEETGNVSIAGTLSEGSSRAIKKNVAAVDPHQVLDAVLGLSIKHWQYKHEDAKHIGPMAEDFYAAFGLGPDDKHLASLDTSGVALASVKALNEKLEIQNEKLRRDNRLLEQRLNRLEKLVGRWSRK